MLLILPVWCCHSLQLCTVSYGKVKLVLKHNRYGTLTGPPGRFHPLRVSGRKVTFVDVCPALTPTPQSKGVKGMSEALWPKLFIH